jgi:hypothetical protein
VFVQLDVRDNMQRASPDELLFVVVKKILDIDVVGREQSYDIFNALDEKYRWLFSSLNSELASPFSK